MVLPPMGVPFAGKAVLMRIAASAAFLSQDTMAERRATKASTSTAWRGEALRPIVPRSIS
jgi:hypothetical protein